VNKVERTKEQKNIRIRFMGYRSVYLFLAKPTLAHQSYSRFRRLMMK